jgi:hypothetical protein
MKAANPMRAEYIDPDAGDISPACDLCGQEHIGMRQKSELMLSGEWHIDMENDVPVFVLDKDIEMAVRQLPNGQLALVINVEGPVKALHTECYSELTNELYSDGDDIFDPDTDDDDEDED